MAADWKVLQAHVTELEELEDDLLKAARAGTGEARSLLPPLHRDIMEKRKRLRELRGN